MDEQSFYVLDGKPGLRQSYACRLHVESRAIHAGECLGEIRHAHFETTQIP
jgi:hypothetical protein